MRRLAMTVFVLVGALAGAGQAAAVTLTVDDDHVQCPAAGYATIQAAVDAAGPGDTIRVCGGTYTEGVSIGGAKTGLSLLSSDALTAVVKGNFFVADAQGVSIQRFRIEPGINDSGVGVGASGSTTLVRNNLFVGGSAGFSSSGSSGTVRDNTFIGQRLVGIALAGYYAASGDILNNSVEGTTEGPGISAYTVGGTTTGTIFGNTVSNAFSAGIDVRSFSGPPGPTMTVTANNVVQSGSGYAFVSSTVTAQNNKGTRNWGPGISVSGGGSSFASNNLRGNGGLDCEDSSIGAGTAGTANTWTGNYGLESSPVGICKK
jgi:hypothetical protein